MQVTTTCVWPGPRCIGRRYGFSPWTDGWLILATEHGDVTGTRISPVKGKRCRQRRPNRNHHCVIVLRGSLTVERPRALDCPPSRCRLNLVLSAHHPRARRGNRVVLGADKPNGEVRDDKGRLNFLLVRGPRRSAKVRSERRIARSIPVAPRGRSGWRVVHSVRLPGLRRGDVIAARARHVASIAGLPYNVFVGSRLVLARRPRAARPSPLVRRSAALNGHITEHNGFNCTHGRSAYESPCVTRKVGQLRVVRRPVNDRGRRVPLFLNLVVGVAEKQPERPTAGDRVRIRHGGHVAARRFREP